MKPDFILRLENERNELSHRHDKLAHFLLIQNPQTPITPQMRLLMRAQLGAMSAYLTLLEARLELLEG